MLRRVGVAGLVIGALVVAFGAPAWAHVTIAPDRAPKGASDVEIAFRVPNEETIPTTKVEVFFPSSPPFLSVNPQTLPGWNASVVTTKLAKPIHTDDGDITEVVTQVTWTATTGGGIPVGDYERFQVIVGRMPSTASSVTLKVLQHYANGDIVRWIEDPSGSTPAPVLTLTSGTSGDATTATTAPAVSTTAKGASQSAVDSAKTIGLVALIVGVVALIVGLGGFAAGRRRPA